MPRVLVVSLVVVAALGISGCAAPDSRTVTTAPTIVVTRPGDFAADNATGADVAHRHDYWMGQDRLVVLDGWPTEPGPGVRFGSSVRVYQYRAPSGQVIPQGTSHVEVTFLWTDAPDDVYTDPELWVKAASEAEPRRIGPSPSGATVTINSTNEQNDLPHQLLSGWSFEFRLSERADLGLLRFKSNVTIHVEAIRGLDIPLYPGHPDRWGGASNVTLVDASRQLAYVQDPDSGCNGFSCPQVESPANGTIVPPDAGFVVATLTTTHGVTSVGLAYHGAEGREFQRLSPTKEEGNLRTYVIEVKGYGDGPYAKASQWEFAPFIEGPIPNGAAYEEYHLMVVAEKRL